MAAPSLLSGRKLPLESDGLARLRKLHDALDLWPGFFRVLKIEDRGGRGMRFSQTSLAIDTALRDRG